MTKDQFDSLKEGAEVQYDGRTLVALDVAAPSGDGWWFDDVDMIGRPRLLLSRAILLSGVAKRP